MSEITFKMLQKVGKQIIFIKPQQKTIPSYPLKFFIFPREMFLIFKQIKWSHINNNSIFI